MTSAAKDGADALSARATGLHPVVPWLVALAALLPLPLLLANAYHQYVVRTDRRNDLATHLKRLGVQTAIHYPVPLHRQAAWSRTYGPAPSLPRCEKLAREILSLPVFPDLTDAEASALRNIRASIKYILREKI